MVMDRLSEYLSAYAASKALASKLGVGHESIVGDGRKLGRYDGVASGGGCNT
jgi:hypothetical protein